MIKHLKILFKSQYIILNVETKIVLSTSELIHFF